MKSNLFSKDFEWTGHDNRSRVYQRSKLSINNIIFWNQSHHRKMIRNFFVVKKICWFNGVGHVLSTEKRRKDILKEIFENCFISCTKEELIGHQDRAIWQLFLWVFWNRKVAEFSILNITFLHIRIIILITLKGCRKFMKIWYDIIFKHSYTYFLHKKRLRRSYN